MFGDNVLATAILERWLHHLTTLNLERESGQYSLTTSLHTTFLALNTNAVQRTLFELAFMDLSRPGKPADNTFIESFNGSLRDECLNIQ